MRKNASVLSIMVMLVRLASIADEALIVYEGFQYNDPATGSDPSSWPVGTAHDLHGEPDGAGPPPDTDALGLTNTWVEPGAADNDNMFLKPGSLTFGDLATKGNHIGFRSNLDSDRYYRPLTGKARDTISGAGEIWFSILIEKIQSTPWGAAQGGFVFGNQVVANSKIPLNDGSDGLVGFGAAPSAANENVLKPYAWDGANQHSGDDELGVSLGDVHLLVGHISFDSGAGGMDEYVLYDYNLNGDSVNGGTLNPIAGTLEVDVKQGDLDTVNLTRQVSLNYDELRIGLTLNAVLALAPGPPPSPDGMLLMVQ